MSDIKKNHGKKPAPKGIKHRKLTDEQKKRSKIASKESWKELS